MKKKKAVELSKKPVKKKLLIKLPSFAKKISLDKSKKVSKFLKLGIKGFDQLIDANQGIPIGSSILVEGGPGSGKTIFCLSTAMNLCKQGKKVLYMSFEEPENELINHMKSFNWKVDEFIVKDILRIKRFDAIDISRSVEALLSAAKKELLIEIDPVFFPEDFKPDFVVIDSLTAIASAFTGEESRFRIYMEQLFRYLERYNITCFLIREVSSPSHVGTTFKEQGEAVSFLSDGIIVIYNVIYEDGTRSAAIEILKLRGVNIKKKIVEFKIINKKGIEINANKILKKGKEGSFNLT
ncbi:MAG: RAD55 family ATPase [Nanoarchaeota archaeon]